MKIILSIVALLFFSSCFNSVNLIPPSNFFSECRISKVVTDGANYKEYTYNDSGMIKMVKDISDGIESIYIYKYISPSEVWIDKEDGSERRVLFLDGNGRVTKAQNLFYKDQRSSVSTSGETINYTYNADGYLSKEERISFRQKDSTKEHITHTWLNGNLASSVNIIHGTGLTFTTAYTYINKENVFLLNEMLLNFDGKKSQNLVQSISKSANGNSIVKTFDYDFDDSGKAVRAFAYDYYGTNIESATWSYE